MSDPGTIFICLFVSAILKIKKYPLAWISLTISYLRECYCKVLNVKYVAPEAFINIFWCNILYDRANRKKKMWTLLEYSFGPHDDLPMCHCNFIGLSK